MLSNSLEICKQCDHDDASGWVIVVAHKIWTLSLLQIEDFRIKKHDERPANYKGE